jgi:hypothetical protein
MEMAMSDESRPCVRPMMIAGYEAMVTFEPGSGLYRGEFVGLNGGADFYAADEVQLRIEAARWPCFSPNVSAVASPQRRA